MLGQNKFLAIVVISNKYYLLSITEQNISLIKELDKPLTEIDGVKEEPEFNKIINKFIQNNKKHKKEDGN